MAERHRTVLTELAELGLSLARDLRESARAAETPEAKAQLATGFHRLSRSVRQAVMLEAKLEKDRRAAAREDAAAEARARPAPA